MHELHGHVTTFAIGLLREVLRLQTVSERVKCINRELKRYMMSVYLKMLDVQTLVEQAAFVRRQSIENVSTPFNTNGAFVSQAGPVAFPETSEGIRRFIIALRHTLFLASLRYKPSMFMRDPNVPGDANEMARARWVSYIGPDPIPDHEYLDPHNPALVSLVERTLVEYRRLGNQNLDNIMEIDMQLYDKYNDFYFLANLRNLAIEDAKKGPGPKGSYTKAGELFDLCTRRNIEALPIMARESMGPRYDLLKDIDVLVFEPVPLTTD
jgi:hypothetical protein